MSEIKDIPVFLFTGFLEGGKTKFIQETLEDKRFNSGERTLLIVCGTMAVLRMAAALVAPDQFSGKNVFIKVVEEPGELNRPNLRKWLDETDSERVVIEYNGMWMLDELYNALPEMWMVYQEFFFADARTFESYNANMRSLVYDKLKSAELVVFNRYDDSIDRMYGTGMRKEAVALRNRYALDYISDRAKKAGFTLDDPEIKAEWDNLTGKYMSDLQRGSDRIEPLDVAGYYNRLMDIAESRLEEKKKSEKPPAVSYKALDETQTESDKKEEKKKTNGKKKANGEKKPVAPPVQPAQEPATPPAQPVQEPISLPAEESVDDGFLGAFNTEEYDPDEDPYNM